MLKNGTRLRSQVCDTQVIVVKATDGLDDLRAGGQPMIPIDAEGDGALQLHPDLAHGNAMGKRYVHADGAEVLVTRSGAGTLAIGAVPLELKSAKPLPASD